MTDVTKAELKEIAAEAEAGDDIPDLDSQTQVDAWRETHADEPEAAL